MKYICNRCGKVIQGNDVTIHYTKGSDGLEIVAVCQPCLKKYLEKTKEDAYRKKDENERMKMKRKW
jgi:ribosome-binding protein aMBF1 (putative translation factor)